MPELSIDQKRLSKIAQKYELKFVILHGSYATGKPREDSDLDIAILGRKPLDFSVFLKVHGEMADIFGDNTSRELDFKTLHRVDPFFRYEVVRTGKLLYGNPTEYEEFKAFAYRAYDDAKPLFELEEILVKKYQTHLNNLSYA